ncbi:MAG: hypothetical protein ABIF89_02640 [bacterium]
MKFSFRKVALAAFSLLLLSSLATAQAIEIPNPLKIDSLEELIDTLTSFVFWLGVVLVPLMVLIGAFYMITAAGEPRRVAKAREIFIWSAIGLMVVLLAKGIGAVVVYILGGTS